MEELTISPYLAVPIVVDIVPSLQGLRGEGVPVTVKASLDPSTTLDSVNDAVMARSFSFV